MASSRQVDAGRHPRRSNTRHVFLALFSLMLLSALPSAFAHAFIKNPMSRNYVAYTRGELPSYCPHCMQGGGPGHTPGICGDPGQNNETMINVYYGSQATYTSGQTVDITIAFGGPPGGTNHGGRHWFSVCPLSRQQATQDCFDRPEHQLVRADEFPGKRYYYTSNTAGGGPSKDVTLRWKLPAGVSCANGCLMQWNWAGYQSGPMPCEDPSWDIPEQCGRGPILTGPPCTGVGCVGILTTEHFRNCMDITITGTTSSPSPSPSPSPAVSPSPGVSPSPAVSPSPSPSPRPPPPSPSPLPSPSPSGCPQTMGNARGDCLCRTRPVGYHQDVELGCRGGVWCYTTGKGLYTNCTQNPQLLYDAKIGNCNWVFEGVGCPLF